MQAITNNRTPRSALSIGLLVCSAVWFVGVGAWYATSASKDGWSETPLFWMLILTVTPVMCIIGGVALVIARRQSRFTWFDWCALGAASIAVVLGCLLVTMVMGSMHAMGI